MRLFLAFIPLLLPFPALSAEIRLAHYGNDIVLTFESAETTRARLDLLHAHREALLQLFPALQRYPASPRLHLVYDRVDQAYGGPIDYGELGFSSPLRLIASHCLSCRGSADRLLLEAILDETQSGHGQ